MLRLGKQAFLVSASQYLPLSWLHLKVMPQECPDHAHLQVMMSGRCMAAQWAHGEVDYWQDHLIAWAPLADRHAAPAPLCRRSRRCSPPTQRPPSTLSASWTMWMSGWVPVPRCALFTGLSTFAMVKARLFVQASTSDGHAQLHAPPGPNPSHPAPHADPCSAGELAQMVPF